jgi:hypothetical protein
MPHSSLTSPNISWTQIKQINQYACYPNPCSMVLCPLRLFLLLLWKLCPWPMHSISLYTNPQDFIARLWETTQRQKNLWRDNGYHWTSAKLVNQSKTIRHLWLTSRRLLEEVNRQWHEAWVVFTRMEQMGLQQELYGSHSTASPVWGRLEQSTPSLSSQPSFSPLLSQPSQFHSCKETVINDDLSDYHESEDPLASLSSLPPPPLGTIGNPIVVSDDEDDIDSLFSCVIMRCNQHSPPLRYSFFIVKTVLIDATFTSTALNTSVTTASCMPRIIANPTARTIEASDFNLSGG